MGAIGKRSVPELRGMLVAHFTAMLAQSAMAQLSCPARNRNCWNYVGSYIDFRPSEVSQPISVDYGSRGSFSAPAVTGTRLGHVRRPGNICDRMLATCSPRTILTSGR